MKRHQKLLGVILGLAFITFTGILFNVDPYETTDSIRMIFFASFGIVLCSLIGGIAYIIKRRKDD